MKPIKDGFLLVLAFLSRFHVDIWLSMRFSLEIMETLSSSQPLYPILLSLEPHILEESTYMWRDALKEITQEISTTADTVTISGTPLYSSASSLPILQPLNSLKWERQVFVPLEWYIQPLNTIIKRPQDLYTSIQVVHESIHVVIQMDLPESVFVVVDLLN